MSIHAVATPTLPSNSTPTIPRQFNPNDLPSFGDPRKICPNVAAYWEQRLFVATMADELAARKRQDIERAYELYNPAFVAVIPASKLAKQTEKAWQQHDAPLVPSVPSVIMPRLRSCRQTRMKKTIFPTEKRELDRFEQKLLKWGILPGWIRDWNQIDFVGDQYLWYADAVAKKHDGRAKLNKMRAFYVVNA